uniref:Atp/GTP-binding protein n=1 Tax=Streptomyces sp. 14R-10 TaxID=1442159 RepID=W0FY03_9ACTN|nr:AAA family ATPase [Streptomyces sp. 14R-10]AHF46182.1 atp/GTP-binding protein [Streptomyces sp. 14R-10]
MSAAAAAPRTATAPPTVWEPGSVIVLVGPPASGKSTWTSARFPPSARVSLDFFRGMLTDSEADQGASEEALALRALVLEGRLRRARTTVCDSTSIEAAARADLLARAHAHGRPVAAVRFDTPLEECLARNAARERTVPEGVVRAMHTALPTVEELYAEGFTAVHHPGDTTP